VCNSVSKLVMFDVQISAGHITRVFALLSRGIFQPLYSWWFRCAATPRSDLAEPDLNFPFDVFVLSRASRFCRDVTIGDDISSDELCASVIALGPLVAAWDLEYTILEGPDLLGMEVTGKLALPLTVTRTPRAVNVGLRDLRAAMDGPSGAKSRGRGRGKATGRPKADPKAASGSRDLRHGRLDVEAVGATLLAVRDLEEFGAEEYDDLEAQLEELPAGDALEVVEACFGDVPEAAEEATSAEDAEVPSATSASPPVVSASGVEGASASADVVGPMMAAAPEVPTPVEPSVIGPTSMGYYLTASQPRRTLCRITGVFKSSTSIKCFVHPGCSTAIAEWKLPSSEAIKAWIQSAEPPPPTATKDQKTALAKAHKDAMLALAAQTVWPGRRRQELIDSAKDSLPPL
jgi:hypothetical protein